MNDSIDKLKQLLLIVDILVIDKEVIEKALNSGFGDFEDALQNYSAVKNGKIDVILTRNIKGYKKSEIAYSIRKIIWLPDLI